MSSDPDIARDIYSLCTIFAIAALVPLVLGLLRIPVAEVVFLLIFGVIFGPEMLGWIQLTGSIIMLSQIGIGFLFFAAGLELEKHAIRGRSGKLALIGWLVSVALAAICAGALEYLGVIHDFAGVAIALTSTALGTLLPVLRDKGLLRTDFGTYFMGAGAIGEFGPVLAISLLLTAKNPVMGAIAVALFGVVALVIAKVPGRLKSDRVMQLVESGHNTSSQTAIRLAVLLLMLLLAAAELFGLDIALGAFVAGIILKLYASGEETSLLQTKLVGLAFGIFIPLFFVVSGAKLNIDSIMANPGLLFLFFGLLLVVRGVPQFFIYRHALPKTRERTRFSLYVATALPIIVAVTSIETDNEVMSPEVAAALVGAGALSVLVFPLIAQFRGPKVVPQEERSAATA